MTETQTQERLYTEEELHRVRRRAIREGMSIIINDLERSADALAHSVRIAYAARDREMGGPPR